MSLVAESEICSALGVGSKAVQLRAVSESWPIVKKHKQGGSERLYIMDMLPIPVRKNLVQYHGSVRMYDTLIPEKSKQIGMAKFQLVKAFRIAKEQAPWGGKAEAAANFLLAYNAGVLMPDVFEQLGVIAERTLDALDKRLRDHNDDYLSICDGRGGWKKHGTTKYKDRNLSEQAKAIFLKCYLHPSRPTVIMSIRAALMTLEKIGSDEQPGESTFRRWLKDFKKNNSHVICLARDGMKAYTDNYGPYGTRDASLLEVGQCLVADGKTLNFNIAHPDTGRPTRMKLIVFFDWASRYPAGWQIMLEENTMAIMAAFRNAVETLGKYPACVYLDNGKAFKSKVFMETDPDFEELTGLYGRVGTAVTFAKPYNGRAKVVERFFLTVQNQLEFMIPSYCGDSIQTKPAWMHRNEKFHKAWHEARTQEWLPTIREAAHIIGAYFKWYGSQPHEDLPAPPSQIFLAGRGPGIDPLQLNNDFLWRKELSPRNCRVRLWNIDYESDCLHGLARNHKIIAKYNTADLGRIWCYTDTGHYLGEAYPVQALHPMASLFGDQVSVDQVKDHNKRLAKLKKQTRQNLADLGVSHESQDALDILPFAQIAQKAPIMNRHTPAGSTMKKLPETTPKEIKRLEAIAQVAKEEQQKEPAIPRPKYWSGDLEHYEWCFELVYKHNLQPDLEDRRFMKEFESAAVFKDYRQRFEDLKAIYNIN
ncbi:MAG: DDE-type integrase/transposase/recombinase [Proteobacteria bacterium]|nr:DDE-type integrase/transposase/recombinase [Pseudomonadota bacterium]MBU1387120.1 DDE-type integrase/transposase/recombinase [Pseudomonadota bacterium]MBU1541563.1 DDE-type integrase/transposase/recombinase [Pseudomonadota bacterium]MBU2429088.1 DDE-type integrase/transposase/recombinase [Pseudomonadota bacterium]MBU2482767.1 DDE-type integrase/transposase/recombinase [Pseudomonadota bacterium]